LEIGSVHDRPGSGRPSVSDNVTERLQEPFTRSPTKSIRRASRDLGFPRATVHKVLHKMLRLSAYKVPLVQQFKPADSIKRQSFAEEMVDCIDHDVDFMKISTFSDEVTFHVSVKVHRHTSGSGVLKIHTVMEHISNSPKINVWRGFNA
jgi:hypothetical protein